MAFGCIWRSPFTSVQVLDQTAPGRDTCPMGISADGSTLFGAALGATDTHWHPCKWNTTTLALTLLEQVVSGDEIAVACSSNGGIAYGGGGTGSGVSAGSQQVAPMTRWTGGGTAGSPLAGGTTSQGWGSGGAVVGRRKVPFPLCSDDGVTAVGSASGAGTYAANKWVSGVQTNLPGLGTGGADLAAGATSISASGSVVVGQAGTGSGVTGGHASYWSGTTLRVLTQAIGGVDDNSASDVAYFTNQDGSIIWGQAQTTTGGAQFRSVYWDSVGTATGGRYGTPHLCTDLTNTQEPGTTSFIYGTAITPGVSVAVGWCPSGGSARHACKWTGTAVADLGTLPGGTLSLAEGCSGDGTQACGLSYDAAFTTWPVRWDSGNAIHALPSLADPADGFQGEAYGFSRDGSLIFGVIDVSEIPPAPPGKLALDNLIVTATATLLSENLVSLRWSDDRGHSWGSPVTQSIGEAGEYRTSLQWQRLAYARDRVFEISWSVPARTAIQGCWVDVTPAQS